MDHFIVVSQQPKFVQQYAEELTDKRMLEMWLHGKSQHTQRAYRADAKKFLSFVRKPLIQVSLSDLQEFENLFLHLSPAGRSRKLSAVKSLFAFAHRIGYLPFNVGAPVKLPALKNSLAERILSESEVHRMLALEENPRNQTLLLLLYAAGLRVSELCSLKWKDAQERGDAAQINVFGKGGKTRAILLSTSVWIAMQNLRGDRTGEDPIFASRKGGMHLDPSQVHRIVKNAAKKAGINAQVSPHWLRHAHASHALDRGAPIHLVQSTLGHSSVATTGRYLHARPSDSSSRYLSV